MYVDRQIKPHADIASFLRLQQILHWFSQAIRHVVCTKTRRHFTTLFYYADCTDAHQLLRGHLGESKYLESFSWAKTLFLKCTLVARNLGSSQ